MIYLDSAATTKPYKEVIDTMVDVMENHWGNPSAPYALGDDARQIIENVRSQIAEDINCEPDEIIFTSGACEANSLAIRGYDAKNYTTCMSTYIEHASINNTHARKFWKNDECGFVYIYQHLLDNKEWYKSDIKKFASIGAANGEIGTIQDIKMLSDHLHILNYIFHTDATQLYPERQLDVKELGIDMMSVSAQKFNGPKGVGFLYVRNGLKLKPMISGSQENGLRGGTYNTAAIAGMGKALEITRKMQENGSVTYVEGLRNRLLDKLMKVPGTTLNGPEVGLNRLANNINLTIDGVDADRLVTLCSLHDIYIGKGSACQSYDKRPSHVLKAIGLTDEQAFNTIRITLSASNNEEEIDKAAKIITKLIERIRGEEK